MAEPPPPPENAQPCWYCDNVGWSPEHAPVCDLGPSTPIDAGSPS